MIVFGGACDQHIKETKSQTIKELMKHVSDYAKSISKQNVYKAVRDIFDQADDICVIYIKPSQD